MAEMVPVWICDTQPLMVEGLKAVLAPETGFAFRCSIPCLNPGEECGRLAAQGPGILILDKALGEQAVIWITTAGKLKDHPAIVVWGAVCNATEALQFVNIGVLGVLKKTIDIPELLDCLRKVAMGQLWVDRSIANATRFENKANLTPREMQVCECIAKGMRSKNIAAVLNITPGTVKIHLKHIYEKTKTRGRHDLAMRMASATF